MEEKDQIKTERYLDGALANQEKQAFESRLQDEPDLKKQLNWQQNLRNNRTRQSKKAALLHMLEEEKQLRDKPVIRRLIPRLRIAASLAIIVLAGGYLFRDNLFVSPDQLPALSLSTEKGDTEADRVGVIQAFNREDYTSILKELQDKPLTAFSLDILRAKGVAQLETDQWDAAIETFQFLQENHPIYEPESQLFIGIAYYRKKDWIASKKALEQIPEKSSYYEQAQKLLKKIP